MKLLVLGHMRHGKDTTCELLKKLYGLTFVSSSYFVGEKAVRPYLEKLGIKYDTMDACYFDRVNHRAAWFDAIAAYNEPDPSRLGRELFAQYDIYCGLRNIREFVALKAAKAFDVCLWVDRSRRCPGELTTSFNIGLSAADYIIDNNGDLEELEINIIETMYRAMDDGKIERREPNILHT